MFILLSVVGGYLIFVGVVSTVGRAAARGGFVLDPVAPEGVLSDAPATVARPEAAVRPERVVRTRSAPRAGSGQTVVT